MNTGSWKNEKLIGYAILIMSRSIEVMTLAWDTCDKN